MSGWEMKPIVEVVRDAGKGALLAELETSGCAPKGNRCRCPWDGCRDKGSGRDYDASIYAGESGNYSVKCFSCETSGDLVDVLCATRGMSKESAIAHLRGMNHEAMPAPKRTLYAVGSAKPGDKDKMLSADVKRLWASLAESDEMGEEYLSERKITSPVARSMVRFCAENNASGQVSFAAKNGHRIAMLMSDVVGEPRGIQVRMARAMRDGDSAKVKSIQGSALEFFGRPDMIEASDVVHVTEGMFDTLTVASWAPEGSCVVGAPGMSLLPVLAKRLVEAGIAVDGKIFCLYSQNDRVTDRGGNKSRQKFLVLAQALAQAGARIIHILTPQRHEDVADWLKTDGMQTWPPTEFARALREPVGAASPVSVESKTSFAMDPKVTSEVLSQDFRTLLALLDDPAHRSTSINHSVAPEDDWWTDEMTGRQMFGKHPVRYPADILRIKYRVEQNVSGRTSKPLKFSRMEIEDAIDLLCSRTMRHPVRDWLGTLESWDGTERFNELADRMQCSSAPMAPVYLRRWAISAVSRVMTPGCKVDTVLILTGGQGRQKSTFFAALAGEAWHTDSMGDLRNKDSLMVLSKFWVLEWAELDSMLRAPNPEMVKSFLSARTDSYRPPYARTIVDVPRPSVIVGSSNQERFLADNTGSRRFWPVAIGAIDIDWVRESRNQLWAEALSAYRAGEQWWLTDDEDGARSDEAKQFSADLDHPWVDIAQQWVAENQEANVVRLKDAMTEIFCVPIERQDRKALLAAGAAFRAIGWEGPKAVRKANFVFKAMVRPAHLIPMGV